MTLMFSLIVNYATLISYIAFSTDLIVQILRIYKRKSSLDVSYKGTAFRLVGSLVILMKFISLKDNYLILGQILLSITAATYLIVIILYRNPLKK